MHSHTHKFDLKSQVYSKSRPDYPEALFWYLMSERIISKNKVVADIGSGTGIFSVGVSPFVKTVYAIEPNQDMRTTAEKQFISYDNLVSINATAEKTSLEDCSVDVITVAQAFHWFDRVSFKKECERILKPDGYVVLIWNDRDISSPVIKDNFEVNQRFCPNFKGSSNGFDFSKDAFSDFFKGEYEITEFENSLVYDEERFISRNLSSSYAPKENEANYKDYVNAVREVFEKHNVDGKVVYPYITRCYMGKV